MGGSLFSGIGGFELGLLRSGLVGKIVWQVEIDDFCRSVLERHFPEVERHRNVKHVGKKNLAPVDVVFGGFPCQDVSSAGKRLGLGGTRSGLWYEFRRVVEELSPKVVLVENVASGARRWLCCVRDDLHQLGYRTRAFRISASDVGAPHLRKRIFVVATVADASSRGADAGKQSGRLRVALQGGHALADADLLGRESERRGRLLDGEQACRSDAHGCRGAMADAPRARRSRGCGVLVESERGRPRPGDEGQVADTDCYAVRHTEDDRLRPTAVDHDAGGRTSESSVGRGAHGVPDRVDGSAQIQVPLSGRSRGRQGVSHGREDASAPAEDCRCRCWPAGPGEPQESWEPPRTVKAARHRPKRLHSLGNAIMPDVAEAVGRAVSAVLESGT